MKTWLILVDHTFETCSGPPFSVLTLPGHDIQDLKEKLKKKLSPSLSHLAIYEFTLWKTKGSLILNQATVTTPEHLAEILSRIDVNDKDTIERLNEAVLVANLGLPQDQTLLVRMPGTSRISIAVGCVPIQAVAVKSSEDEKPIGSPLQYQVDQDPLVQDLVIRASNRGVFVEDDIESNSIWEGASPGFVIAYEEILRRKRRAADNVGGSFPLMH
jgi:hypothetical protein